MIHTSSTVQNMIPKQTSFFRLISFHFFFISLIFSIGCTSTIQIRPDQVAVNTEVNTQLRLIMYREVLSEEHQSNRPQIRRFIRRRVPLIRTCYQGNQPTQKIQVKMKIQADGIVKNTEVIGSDPTQPSMVPCLMNVFNKIRFGSLKQNQEVDVIQAFRFDL